MKALFPFGKYWPHILNLIEWFKIHLGVVQIFTKTSNNPYMGQLISEAKTIQIYVDNYQNSDFQRKCVHLLYRY